MLDTTKQSQGYFFSLYPSRGWLSQLMGVVPTQSLQIQQKGNCLQLNAGDHKAIIGIVSLTISFQGVAQSTNGVVPTQSLQIQQKGNCLQLNAGHHKAIIGIVSLTISLLVNSNKSLPVIYSSFTIYTTNSIVNTILYY